MFIPDPDFYPSQIPDPGSRSNKREGKLCIFFLIGREKKELFTHKIVTKVSKIWVRNPGSEIRVPRSRIRAPGFEIRDPRSGIRDPGSEIRDPRSGIRDPGSEI
jgi:hypothetical protein